MYINLNIEMNMNASQGNIFKIYATKKIDMESISPINHKGPFKSIKRMKDSAKEDRKGNEMLYT